MRRIVPWGMKNMLRDMGVRGRLLLAFLGISSFAVLGAVAALFAFAEIGEGRRPGHPRAHAGGVCGA